MNIYLISQSENNDYDTYDSAVVYAKDEEEAKTVNPGGEYGQSQSTWCSSPDKVTVELMGEANEDIKEKGIILSSFNAG